MWVEGERVWRGRLLVAEEELPSEATEEVRDEVSCWCR